jgi:hypothetical protein
VVERGVACLVLYRKGIRFEEGWRHDREAAMAGGQMQGGVAGGIGYQPEAGIRQVGGGREILTGAKGSVEGGDVHERMNGRVGSG